MVQVRCAERADNARRQHPAKKPEDARFFPFLFARLTLNVKDGREIVPDPTPAQQPRGLRPHGLRREAKPLKENRLCQTKNQGEGDNVAGLPTEFRFDQSPVRAILQDGEPWFVAKDVCDILDLDDPSRIVSRLDDDESGYKLHIRTPAGTPEMLTVNKSASTASSSPAGSRRPSASENG